MFPLNLEFSALISLKKKFPPFFSLLSFWHYHCQCAGRLHAAPQVSVTLLTYILPLFLSFFTVFQFTDSFFGHYESSVKAL